MKYAKGNNKTYIENYCTHGNLEIWTTKFKKLYELHKYDIETKKYLLCDKCKEDFLKDDNKTHNYNEVAEILNTIKNKEVHIRTYYPEIYKAIVNYTDITNDFYEKLYLVKHSIKYKICENCKEINHRYDKQCCSTKCAVELLQKSGHYSKIRKDYHTKNVTVENNKKYPLFSFNIEKGGIIKKYCKHGDLSICYKTFSKLYKLHGKTLNNSEYLCDKCKEDLITNEFAIDNEKKIYYTISKKGRSESAIKINCPHIWKKILSLSAKNWVEQKYMFEKNISTPNICSMSTCGSFCTFNKGQLMYNLTCSTHSHISGISLPEMKLHNFIKSAYDGEVIQSYRKLKKEIDIYIPDLNIGFEFNGLYWHNDNHLTKSDHQEKWKLCKDNNIKLITIWEDDWNFKQNLIKSMITNQLGLNSNKVYGRKTEIKEVSFKISKEFLNENHIQGNCPSSIRLGLYYNNELVSLMTFGKKRMILKSLSKHNNNQFELLRFCNKQNTSVIGSASKLFKYFIKTVNPYEVVSYANLDISNGKLYETLGFDNKGLTGINYWWVKDKRYHRSNFMKHKLVKDGADPSKTENEIMRENGYSKIYGTGNLKYIWYKN